MSLEIVDRVLRNWKDPKYTGFNETLSNFNNIEPPADKGMVYRTQLSLDDCRFLKPNKNVIEEYETSMEGLRSFYRDHNIIEVKHDRIKINAYKMRYPQFTITYDEILKYMTSDTKYILDISYRNKFMALHCLINSNAYVISADNLYHEYNWYGKNFIDAKFPGRNLTISNYLFDTDQNKLLVKMHPDLKLDIIYLHMSKNEDVVYKIITMHRRFADENTIIILDSVCPHQGWGIGPYIAMNKLIQEGVLLFMKHTPTDFDYMLNGLAVLKYNFDPTYKQKLTLQNYIDMEINIPLMEFTNFIITDSTRSETQVTENMILLYKNKFAEYDIAFDDYLKKILKEKHNIIL